MPTDEIDQLIVAPKTGPYSPIELAAIDSSLTAWDVKRIGRLLGTLNKCEQNDPANESDRLTIHPYSLGSAEPESLGGHESGLALWTGYSAPDKEGTFIGVILWIDLAMWQFVPASAMPQADRDTVMRITGFADDMPAVS
jgi:hypothetical protein